METEIKLGFDDEQSLYSVKGADWFSAFFIDSDPGQTYLLENSYLDTEDLKVTSRGGMIRSRHYVGGDSSFYEFTVKYGGGSADGLHKRYEWNVRSDDGILDINDFKAKAIECGDSPELLDEVLSGINEGELGLLCMNTFKRSIIKLKYGESLIEACFDYGDIKDSEDKVKEHICELELELVSGDVKDVLALADIITGKAPCKPFDDTKYHRTIKYLKRN